MFQWFIDPDKKEPQRERPLGPVLVKAPMLLLVTESNHAEVVYRPDRLPHQFVVLKASLQSTSVCLAGETVPDESPVGPGGTRICTKAAIGLGSDCKDACRFLPPLVQRGRSGRTLSLQPNPSSSLLRQGLYLTPVLVLAVSIFSA